MFPAKLLEVLQYLNSIVIAVSESHEDGRVNSIDDEDTIIDLLIEKYGEENIIKPPPRCWWDVKIFGYFFNIKSSGYDAADNFSSKSAILWALTSLSEEDVAIKGRDQWKQFQDRLKDAKDTDNNRDYYILSINKNTNEVHLSSLKSLNRITSNGNNLPFQINWKHNTTTVSRTHRQSYDFLVQCYKESVRKKLAQHDDYESL